MQSTCIGAAQPRRAAGATPLLGASARLLKDGTLSYQGRAPMRISAADTRVINSHATALVEYPAPPPYPGD